MNHSRSTLAVLEAEENVIEARLRKLLRRAKEVGAREVQRCALSYLQANRHWRGYAARRPPHFFSPFHSNYNSASSRAAGGPRGYYRPVVAPRGPQPEAVRQFDVGCRLSRGGLLDTAVLAFVSASLHGHPDGETAASLCAAALAAPGGSPRFTAQRSQLKQIKERLKGHPQTRGHPYSVSLTPATDVAVGRSDELWAHIAPTEKAAAAEIAQRETLAFLSLSRDESNERPEPRSPVKVRKKKHRRPHRSEGFQAKNRGMGDPERSSEGLPGYAAPIGRLRSRNGAHESNASNGSLTTPRTADKTAMRVSMRYRAMPVR